MSGSKYIDVVIFDAPPVLSVTDALVISSHVQGTILVIRSGVTTYDLVQRAVRTLQSTKTKILGVVVNATDIRKLQYYYGYYSNYGYNNYSGEGQSDPNPPHSEKSSETC